MGPGNFFWAVVAEESQNEEPRVIWDFGCDLVGLLHSRSRAGWPCPINVQFISNVFGFAILDARYLCRSLSTALPPWLSLAGPQLWRSFLLWIHLW